MAEEDLGSGVRGSSSGRETNSVEAIITRDVAGVTGESSSCNEEGNNNAESSSVVTSEHVREENLEDADLWMKNGFKAAEESDYAEAAECYSRALEIRVSQFGELSPHCVSAYYKYGCALLYKVQAEADPLVSMPTKDGPSHDESSIKSNVAGESSTASVSEPVGRAQSCVENPSVEGDAEGGQDESEDEDLADGDEDESDLDLAWKMLDVARAIVEKHSGDAVERVDILSALAEVALEREDVETSQSDYLKALSILENLVEPDFRRIAELNFRICLCLEIGSKPEEAIPYCQKAISVCKSRVQRLMNEEQNRSTETSEERGRALESCSSSSALGASPGDTKAEIETLNGLCGELEKKLEDLQQLMSNPKSILSDILGIMTAKARGAEKDDAHSVARPETNAAGPSGSNLSTTFSQTNGTSGVTHLGVVGRGIKRAVVAPLPESVSTKRSRVEPPLNEDGKNS